MSRKDVDTACRAHTDLNVFQALVAILEGGCIYTRVGAREADVIIRRCRKIQQTLLTEMDAATAAACKESGNG